MSSDNNNKRKNPSPSVEKNLEGEGRSVKEGDEDRHAERTVTVRPEVSAQPTAIFKLRSSLRLVYDVCAVVSASHVILVLTGTWVFLFGLFLALSWATTAASSPDCGFNGG
ncbi:uncharacterized protein BYT42DRAFT_546435 [Radiomyces spectabilis]|uniref:uncharacterized protein n=1 Tax=Radiomyces spectabilis TaxID=64574 RepID=UPI00221FF2A2|nr:uncharacterized protein BYT42DRAFT_546435 [Radiomyces spectabilis]KAI8377805.1 hypothetical protein BYT42DRAFT_546435 [Radiomyces spectabilis]